MRCESADRDRLVNPSLGDRLVNPSLGERRVNPSPGRPRGHTARLRSVPSEWPTLDLIAASVLALAALRGVWIGAVREAFSLAGLAAAIVAVRTWREPVASWLEANVPVAMTGLAAQLLAGLVLGVGSLVAVALIGRLVRRGVRGAGLGLLDRLAGAVLGAAEGAVLVAALTLGLAALLGREDSALVGTRTLAALEATEHALGVAAPDVSSAPPEDPPSGRARE
jgi:membrane protein required for colicin V production